MNDDDQAQDLPARAPELTTPMPATVRRVDDASTPGAASVTGTGGQGSAAGTDSTADVGSTPRALDAPDPTTAQRDDTTDA